MMMVAGDEGRSNESPNTLNLVPRHRIVAAWDPAGDLSFLIQARNASSQPAHPRGRGTRSVQVPS